MDHHVVCRHAVELENVLDEFLFVLFNGAGLLALLHHGHDLAGQLLALVPVQPGKDGAAEQKQQIEHYTDSKQDGPYLVPRHGNSPLCLPTGSNFKMIHPKNSTKLGGPQEKGRKRPFFLHQKKGAFLGFWLNCRVFRAVGRNYLMALVRTSSPSSWAKASRLMAPRSSPERCRTETVPFSISRSPTTSI